VVVRRPLNEPEFLAYSELIEDTLRSNEGSVGNFRVTLSGLNLLGLGKTGAGNCDEDFDVIARPVKGPILPTVPDEAPTSAPAN